MEGLRVRRARKSDRSSIRRLVWRVRINPFGLRWQNFFVATDDTGRLVGCGQLKPHGRGTFELASIAVDEKSRGRGIARAVIEALVDRGPRPLFLMCLPRMTGLYARFGFVIEDSGRLPRHFQDVERMAAIMRHLHPSRAPVVMRLD